MIRLSNRIAAQLKTTPGVVRFSLRTNLPRREFWTLSVWQEPGAAAAIEDFIHSGAHAAALRVFPHLTTGKEAFARWTSEFGLLDWPEALRRLAG